MEISINQIEEIIYIVINSVPAFSLMKGTGISIAWGEALT